MFSSAEAPELGDLELMAGLPFVSFRAAGCGAKFGEGGGSVQRARLRSGVAPARLVARPGAGPRVLACYTAIGVFAHPEW